MRILLVADVPYGNPCSGSEKVLYHQAVGLSQNGTKVSAIVRHSEPCKPGYKKFADVEVGRFYAPTNRYLRFSWQHIRYPGSFYNRLRRSAPFSAIIAHQPFSLFALLTLRKTESLPLLYNFHSPSHEEYQLSTGPQRTFGNMIPALIRREVERYCLKKSHKVIVLSQFMKQKVIDIHRIPEKRIVVNSGGVDLNEFKPPADRARIKKKLHYPCGKIHLLTVRNLEPRMGLDNLLRAIQLLRKRYRDVHLTVGGDGPEKKRLKELVRELCITEDVTMAGFISAKELPMQYGAADFFILPTHQLEGFGLVTIESLACGTPVLGTPVGGTKEILSGLDSALLFENAGAEAMAGGIDRVIESFSANRFAYRKLRTDCRDFAQKRYSWQRHVKNLESTLNEMPIRGASKARRLQSH